MYAGLPGHRASDSPPATIPTDILSTSCRPDLFLCVGSTIKIPELTVCSNTREGFSNAQSRKQCKQMYTEMVGDLESRGYSVSYNTIEIGSLGHYTNQTLKALCNFASKLITKSECSNSSTVWPKSASHVLIQYSWPVSLANGTLADACSHFDFYINSFLYAPVLVLLFSVSLL